MSSTGSSYPRQNTTRSRRQSVSSMMSHSSVNSDKSYKSRVPSSEEESSDEKMKEKLRTQKTVLTDTGFADAFQENHTKGNKEARCRKDTGINGELISSNGNLVRAMISIDTVEQKLVIQTLDKEEEMNLKYTHAIPMRNIAKLYYSVPDVAVLFERRHFSPDMTADDRILAIKETSKRLLTFRFQSDTDKYYLLNQIQLSH